MAGKKEDRIQHRLELRTYRLNATLAIIISNRTTGCIVPIKDFSKTGLGVFSKVKVDIGTLVRLSLEDINLPPLEGRVIWCGPSSFDIGAPPTHPFRIGIEFTPRDDTARETQIAIYTFIARLLGQRS